MKTKKVLAILSEFGYWGVELVGPLRKLEAAGYTVDFMTTHGKKAEALPPSYDTTYIDPPLGVCVTTPADAEMVNKFESEKRLENPMNMSEFIPERPYYSSENFLRSLENYYKAVKTSVTDLVSKYDAILLVGGSGPIVDMVNNQRLHELVLGFNRADKPISAICYGVPVLAFARDFNERKCIIRGKHVTGHCIEYDYHDGTGFLHTDFNMGPPPYVLEYLMSDAVGPEGQFHGNFGKETSVVVDYPFVTARSLQCSHEFGDQLVNVLDKGLKRYGW
jgi:putative intracellular protease/amidase